MFLRKIAMIFSATSSIGRLPAPVSKRAKVKFERTQAILIARVANGIAANGR
jgi:hypothetical protein